MLYECGAWPVKEEDVIRIERERVNERMVRWISNDKTGEYNFYCGT